MQEDQNQQQPGWVFKPGGQTEPPAAAPAPQSASLKIPHPPSQQPIQQPVQAVVPPVVTEAPPNPPTVPEPTAQSVPTSPVQEPEQYLPQQNPDPDPQPQDADAIHWSASEYVAHQKSLSWFIILGVGAVLLSAFLYLLTRDVISVVLIIVLAIALGMFGSKQPKTLNYNVSREGIQIGDKLYDYGAFKSFSVMREDALNYISLIPLRRLMPPLAIYYSSADEDRILDVLADYLPFENRSRDFFDRLSRKARF